MFYRGEVEVKRVPRALFEQEIDDRRAEGWRLVKYRKDEAVLRKSGKGGSFLGHLTVWLFTFFFTLGLGNLLYDQNKRQTSSRELRIKVYEVSLDQMTQG